MDFDLFGTNNIKSPEQLAERRALVRSLMARQMSQQPRDMWGGINSLVGAISGRIAESQLDSAEKEAQVGAESAWKPFNDAVTNKQTPDLGMVTSILSNPWTTPGRRSIAEDFYRQQLKASQPVTELTQSDAESKVSPKQSAAPWEQPVQGNASAPSAPGVPQNTVINNPPDKNQYANDLAEPNRPPPGTGSALGKKQQIHTKYGLER